MGPLLGGTALVRYTSDKTNIIFDGNSLVEGNALGPTDQPTKGIVPQLAGLFPINGNITIHNIGVSGQAISDMRSRGSLFADGNYAAGKKNVLLVWEGTNSICNNGVSGADAGAQMAQYCAERLAAHPDWLIVMLTTLPRFNIGSYSIPDGNAQLDIFDAYIKANQRAMGVKKIVDVRAAGIFTYTGPTVSDAMAPYMIDPIHYNAAGGTVLAQYCADALRRLPAR